MEQNTLELLRQQIKQQELTQTLGLELLEVAPGKAVARLATGPHLTNIFGGIHGTAIFAVIDEAFQAASNAHGVVAVALNMSLTFHLAPANGEVLTATADEVHLGRRTASYYIRVQDGQGRLIATCQALAYRKREQLPFLGMGK